MSKVGILFVSHVPEIASGVYKLMSEIGPNVDMTYCGGTDTNEIGTNFEKILEAIESNPQEKILAFYDLGSAKMNLDVACEMSDKEVIINDTAFIEGVYTAVALTQADVDLEEIMNQLKPLIIK